MVVVMKSIKPQKLKIDKMRLELLNAMRKSGTVIQKDFEQTTATWKHKVKFETLVSLKQPGPTILVDTDDEIYRYVNEGTKAHDIWAGYYTGKSKHKVLVFPSGFTAKTTPGSLRSGPGGSSGKLVHTPYVRHKGSKARSFDAMIKKKREKWFKRQMQAAMNKAAKVSGNPVR